MKKSLPLVFVFLFMVLLSGCGHEHIFTDATCITPKTCIECEKTEGEALGHCFLDATCELPATCEICGETEGEALGHTIEVGKCSNCNEYQGMEIIESIFEKLTYANSQTDLALIAQTSGIDYYNDFLNGISYYESAQTVYEEALDLCGNYSDLKDLRRDIKNLINALPLTVYGEDDASLNLYLDDLNKFFTLQAKCQLTMIMIDKLIN